MFGHALFVKVVFHFDFKRRLLVQRDVQLAADRVRCFKILLIIGALASQIHQRGAERPCAAGDVVVAIDVAHAEVQIVFAAEARSDFAALDVAFAHVVEDGRPRVERVRRHEIDAVAEIAAVVSCAFFPDIVAVVVDATVEMEVRVGLPAEQRLRMAVPPCLDPLVDAEADEMLPFKAIRLVEEIQIFTVMGRFRRECVVHIRFDDMAEPFAFERVQLDAHPVAEETAFRLKTNFISCAENFAAVRVIMANRAFAVHVVRVVHVQHVRQIAFVQADFAAARIVRPLEAGPRDEFHQIIVVQRQIDEMGRIGAERMVVARIKMLIRIVVLLQKFETLSVEVPPFHVVEAHAGRTLVFEGRLAEPDARDIERRFRQFLHDRVEVIHARSGGDARMIPFAFVVQAQEGLRL